MKTGIAVGDAMTQEPVCVSPDATLDKCAKIMKNKNIGSLIIREDSKLRGILTEWDIVRKIVADNKDPRITKAKEVMVSQVVTISPESDVYDALVKMRNNDIRHLPVVKSGKLVGFLTIKDVLKIQPELFEILLDKVEAGIHLKGF